MEQQQEMQTTSVPSDSTACSDCGREAKRPVEIRRESYCVKCARLRIRHAHLYRTILIGVAVVILVPNLLGAILLISRGRWDVFDWRYVINAGFLLAIFYNALKYVWPVAKMQVSDD